LTLYGRGFKVKGWWKTAHGKQYTKEGGAFTMEMLFEGDTQSLSF
jgi:hypothetical protein